MRIHGVALEFFIFKPFFLCEKKNHPYPFTCAPWLPASFIKYPCYIHISWLCSLPYICPDHETNNKDPGICPTCIFIELPQYKWHKWAQGDWIRTAYWENTSVLISVKGLPVGQSHVPKTLKILTEKMENFLQGKETHENKLQVIKRTPGDLWMNKHYAPWAKVLPVLPITFSLPVPSSAVRPASCQHLLCPGGQLCPPVLLCPTTRYSLCGTCGLLPRYLGQEGLWLQAILI